MNDWINFMLLVERKLQSGNCSIEIGRTLLQQHCWGEAARALKNGITKGDLDDPNEASALLLECYSMMGTPGMSREFREQ